MKVFKFYPKSKSKFHFGDSQGSLTQTVASDQLFSALYNCMIALFGEQQAREYLAVDGEGIFSSLFPGISFIDQSDTRRELYFWNRPLAPITIDQEPKDLLAHKKVKRIKYISIGAWRKLQRCWKEQEACFAFDFSQLEVLGDTFACTTEEVAPFDLSPAELSRIQLFNLDARPRVDISRLNDRSEHFYFQEELELSDQQLGNYRLCPFYYFLCRIEPDRALTAAIRLMADEGLGGKRSLGLGLLGEVVEEDWTDELFGLETACYMNLSSVFPTEFEIEKVLRYELGERSGYIYSGQGLPLRRKRVRFLREGSIFEGRVTGKIIDLRPAGYAKHPVYFNGAAFLVPVGEATR